MIEFRENVLGITDYVQNLIDDHQPDPNEIKDLQDALHQIALDPNEEILREKLGIKSGDVRQIGQDLFGAGFGTTTEHFYTAFKILGANPDIQTKLRDFINSAVPENRPISLNDRSLMNPYVEAFLIELTRFFSQVALAIFHSTSEDLRP